MAVMRTSATITTGPTSGRGAIALPVRALERGEALDAAQYELARRLWHYGISPSKIADACGVNYYELIGIAYRNRVDFPRRRGHTKVNADVRGLMERMRDGGMTYQQIADSIGCHVNTVAKHLRNYNGGGK